MFDLNFRGPDFLDGGLTGDNFSEQPDKSLNMGRELQKKKNRSSTAKITKKAKSKKKLLQNPIIAANW